MIISAFSSYSEPKEFAIQKLVTNDTVEHENNKREEMKNAAKTGKRRWMPTEKVTVMEDYGGDDENENDSPSHKKAIAASMPIVAPQKPVFHLEIIKKRSICFDGAGDVEKTDSYHTKITSTGPIE